MDCSLLRKTLENQAEPEYRKFAASLLPEGEPLLGVRLPALRRLAKELAPVWQEFLADAGDNTFEEVMLQGMVIGYAKGDWQARLEALKTFIPKIRNWSICDSVCSSLTMAKERPEEFWAFLLTLKDSPAEYTVRFAVVMVLRWYCRQEYLARCLAFLESVRHEGYYAKMAVAWAISIFYLKFPHETTDWLFTSSLPQEVLRKALCKVSDSKTLTPEGRKTLESLRRRLFKAEPKHSK